jgi:alpha-L-fucosidase
MGITASSFKLRANAPEGRKAISCQLPGLSTPVKSATTVFNGKKVELNIEKTGDSFCITVPDRFRSPIAFVITVQLAGNAVVDQTVSVHPNVKNDILAHFAETKNAVKKRVGWMEKFGEWKHVTQVFQWKPNGTCNWNINVLKPGAYKVALKYRGKVTDKITRVVWNIKTDEGAVVQNQQAATSQYQSYPMGILTFKTAGKHTLTVSLIEGDEKESSLESIELVPVLV